MRGLGAWWHFLRGTNLSLVVITLLLIGYKTRCPFGWGWLLAVTLGTVAVTAGGNILNDLEDQELDNLNKPNRVWIGTLLSEKQAWSLYLGFHVLGWLGAWWTGSDEIMGCFCMAIFLLYVYSTILKCMPVVGNVTVAGLCALVVMQYVWAVPLETMWQERLCAYAGFAFGVNWLREWVKDLEDRSGDARCGCQTLAVRCTWDQNRQGLLVLWLLTTLGIIGGAYSVGLLGISRWQHVLGGVLVLGALGMGRSIGILRKQEDATRLSKYLKYYLGVGLLVLVCL